MSYDEFLKKRIADLSERLSSLISQDADFEQIMICAKEIYAECKIIEFMEGGKLPPH